MTEGKGRIHAAIVAIMREIGAVGKGGRNEKQNYNFRKIEDIYNQVQPLLAKHGVYATPEVIEQQQVTGETSKGSMMLYLTLKVKYRFYADDGSFVETTVVGQGMDAGDKAAAKAMTASHKAALTQVLNIPFAVVDPEQHSPEFFQQHYSRVTITDLGDIKKQWHSQHGKNGDSKEALAQKFGEWVAEKTGHEFDTSDPKAWTRQDYRACSVALTGASI